MNLINEIFRKKGVEESLLSDYYVKDFCIVILVDFRD